MLPLVFSRWGNGELGQLEHGAHVDVELAVEVLHFQRLGGAADREAGVVDLRDGSYGTDVGGLV